MTVFDKLSELKDALQGDSGDDKKEDQKEGWSDKVIICISVEYLLDH